MANSSDTPPDSSVRNVDLSADEMVRNIKLSVSKTKNDRLKFLLEKLTDCFHTFAAETRLTNKEWTEVLQFITLCGQSCTDTRQEMYLLSDVLGLSALLDVMNHPKPANATKSTVLGPFHTHDAPKLSNGESIASPGKGEMCLFLGSVSNTKGEPIEGINIDVWEADGDGLYDNQYENRTGPDMRASLTSDSNGKFYFKCVKPVSYTVPYDGPVGLLLAETGRHAYRPAHIHFYITDPSKKYEELVSALFIRGDQYESSDAVFGVKSSLLVDAKKVEDAVIAEKYHVKEQDWLITYDFVLTTPEETEGLFPKTKGI